MKAYKRITDHIIKKLEEGKIPWNKPWNGKESAPRNAKTKRYYRGINVFLLFDFDNPNFVTFNQAKEAGGNVKKGERGTPVVFWKFAKKTKNGWSEADPEHDDREDIKPILRFYTLFNVEQCESLPEKYTQFDKPQTNDNDRIQVAEAIVAGYPNPPTINTQEQNQAYYRPSTDEIMLPKIEQFHGSEYYYATLFHEMVHSTGHQTRLNRPEVTGPVNFGSEKYSREELVAEMGATFLCAEAGIENATIENQTAYIQNWLKVLKQPKNEKLIVHAGAQAQKAVEYISPQAVQKELVA